MSSFYMSILYKKCKVIILVLLCGGIVSACSDNQSKEKLTDADKTDYASYSIYSQTITKDGFFKISNGMLGFTDAATDESVYVCSKTNCTHEPYDSVTNPEPTCEAYVPEMIERIAVGNNKIYLFGYLDNDSEMSTHTYVYEENMNGSDRKKICDIDLHYSYILHSYCDGNYLAFDYMLTEDADGNEYDMRKAGYCIVDLSDNSYTLHTLENAYGVNLREISNGVLYAEVLKLDSEFDLDTFNSLYEENQGDALDYEDEYFKEYAYSLDLSNNEENFYELNDGDFIISGGYVYCLNSEHDLEKINLSKGTVENTYKLNNITDKEYFVPKAVVGNKIVVGKYLSESDQMEWNIIDSESGKVEKTGKGTIIIDWFDDKYIYENIILDEPTEFNGNSSKDIRKTLEEFESELSQADN
jgi:hypothetical protein